MPIVALATAAGAPGATTTALGLALTWPGPTLLIEADPAGSALSAGYFRGTVDHSLGLLNLALSGRRDDLPAALLAESRQVGSDPERRILLGLADPAQASTMLPWWEHIGDALHQVEAAGYAVIVDLGRITQTNCPVSLLEASDLAMLVCRGTLSSAVRTQPAAGVLRDSLGRQGREDCAGLAVIGATDYQPAEVGRALGMPILLQLPEDRRQARVLSDGATERKFATSSLARAYRDGARALLTRITQHHDRVRGDARARLGLGMPGQPVTTGAAGGGAA